MEVAFVHDHLVQRGGSERTLATMLRAFPDAPVYTAFYWPDATYAELEERDVRPMAIDRVPALRRHHRLAFPTLPFFFSRRHVDADVVICSSSGWAQGVQTSGRKIVYFHALAQWLHSPIEHVARGTTARRAALAVARKTLTGWDRRTVRGADRHLVMGETMRRRVADVYGVDAEILPPPISVEVEGQSAPVDGVEPGFVLAAARLMPYKNLDAVVGAFAQLPDERLGIAGDGPERAALEAASTANVRFVGTVGDAHLRWLYANCRALVSAGFEAYPLTPIEAAGFGKPTLALREGGSVDVVIEGRTGEFFDRPVPDAIAKAVRRLAGGQYDAAELARLRERHAEHTFAAALRAIVDEELAKSGHAAAT